METKSNTASEAPNVPEQKRDRPATYTTTLLFDTENGVKQSPPKRQDIVITPGLAKVFVRAAQTSANDSNEPPLAFSTLLVALLVDEDGWLKRHFEIWEVRFDEIATHRRYSEPSLRSLSEVDLKSEYLTTVSARAALDEATRIARLTTRGMTVDMRHLCAAYPVLSKWHVQDFAKFNIDRLQWARAFGGEMAQRFPKERSYWGSYADRASPVPLTSFSADVYTEEDLLGIDRGVDALALLIASTRTVTPLAIGVFGPWGSGKTFFMRHLQKRIVGIRRDEQARIEAWIANRNDRTAKPEDAPLYFGQIAQVEFNAWHYNEGNLVASLVEHLFRNLRVLPNEGDEELAKRRAEMLKQLKVLTSELSTVDETINAAQKNVAEAKASVEQASEEAEKARNDVREKANAIETQNAALVTERQKLDDAIRTIELPPNQVDIDEVIAVALGPLAPLLGEVRKTFAAARDQAFDWKEFAARVFSTKGLVVVALLLIAPFVLWLTQLLEGQWAAFTASMAAAFAGFGNALDILKRRRTQFEEKLAELEAKQREQVAQARSAIEAQHAKLIRKAEEELKALTQTLDSQRKALAEQEAEVSKAAQQLAARAREHDAKLAERVKAEKKLRATEAELERLSSALLLEEFIKDRSSTDEYRKQLGFLALVRRDIERLSNLIDAANKSWLAVDNNAQPPLLNRIVLYIDDLDRCKESTVLSVLEAVHLLLAFPLFVCAVAVDPHWVEKCLRKAHWQLFDADKASQNEASKGQETDKGEDKPNSHENAPRADASDSKLSGPATVGDYLEKIFQIPIWMSPIGTRTRATLVNSLLGPTAAPAPRAGGAAQRGTSPDTTPGAAEGGAFNVLVAKARETPDPLRISPEETAFVDQIAALLSDRPRALKRFVNIYRLLKASLPDIERATFVDASPSSAYRICLSQLALFTSHPRLAPSLVAAIGKPNDDPDVPVSSPTPDDTSLQAWFDSLAQPRDPHVESALQLIPNRDALLLESFRRWLPHTSRYLFHRTD